MILSHRINEDAETSLEEPHTFNILQYYLLKIGGRGGREDQRKLERFADVALLANSSNQKSLTTTVSGTQDVHHHVSIKACSSDAGSMAYTRPPRAITTCHPVLFPVSNHLPCCALVPRAGSSWSSRNASSLHLLGCGPGGTVAVKDLAKIVFH